LVAIGHRKHAALVRLSEVLIGTADQIRPAADGQTISAANTEGILIFQGERVTCSSDGIGQFSDAFGVF
jgi:hypothetical protein